MDTETVTVNGNGTYTTPTGYTLTITGAATGTYQWNASYSGDTNNNTASDINNTQRAGDGQHGRPDDHHHPQPHHGHAGHVVGDAERHGGPRRRHQPDRHHHLHAGSAGRRHGGHRDGRGQRQRHLHDADRLHAADAGTVTGTYQWNASYSGDNNDDPASNTNDPNERVTVSAASPTLATTPSPTRHAGAAARDAERHGDPGGRLQPDGHDHLHAVLQRRHAVDTETVAVSGNGTYTTPTGFTLPTTGTATGTYQWNATYSGDSNNNTASDVNNPNEQVTVSAASPTLSTTPSPTTVTLGATAVTLKDTADLAGGFNPTGTITFTLFFNGGGTPVDTETVDGQRQRHLHHADRLHPADHRHGDGHLPVGRHLQRRRQQQHRQRRNNPAEQVTVSAASPTLSTTPNPATVTLGTTPVTLNDTADLEGGFNPTGTITFTLFYNGGHAGGHRDGRRSTATAPTPRRPASRCRARGTVDGHLPVERHLQRRQQQQRRQRRQRRQRAGDGQRRQPDAQHHPDPDTVTLGTTTVTLNDAAQSAGGFNPTGTITFTLFYNGGGTVDTETVTVNGNGIYTTPTGFTLPTTGTVDRHLPVERHLQRRRQQQLRQRQQQRPPSR